MTVLDIPLQADGEVLSIDLLHDLPEDPSEICVLLENENCSSRYWLEIGSAYGRLAQAENAMEVLNKGLELAPSEDQRAQFYAAMCWLELVKLRETSVLDKKPVYERAVEMANRALQLDHANAAAMLANGVLSLSIGNLDNALEPFVQVLNKSNNSNIHAHFGRARILYHRKNYRGALKAYQSILRKAPRFPTDPRIGIGLCFWQLGDKTRAFASWDRSAQLDPKSVAANTLIGIWYLDAALHNLKTREEFELAYKEAIYSLQRAYQADSNAQLASLGLTSYLFSRQNMNAVQALSDRVLQQATLPSLTSDALFWKARVHHYNEQYDAALAAYNQALETDKTNYVAAIGKGMIQIIQKSPEALLTFETLSSEHPRSAEVALYSGVVYASRSSGDPKRTSKAISALERYVALKRAADESPAPEALVYLTILYQQTKQVPPVKAHEYIREVANQGVDTLEVNNNRGVLAYHCGFYEEARASFQAALTEAEKEGSASRSTIRFNLARVDDASGRPEAAREGYQAVLETAPGYVDALVRETYLSIVIDGSNTGEEKLNQLLVDHDDSLEVRALQGWYLRRQKRSGVKLEDAEQTHHKHTLMDLDKHDTYALVAMGNLYLANARETRGADAQARKDKAYFKASEFFDKALQIDSSNAYAAQGIAIIFAETKRLQLALQIFGRVREVLDDAAVLVNSGHCYFELKQYGKAIEMYDQALAKAPGDAGLFTLLGRAWFSKGSVEKSLDAMDQAVKYSEKAHDLQPDTPALAFNVAFLHFQYADLVRRLPVEKRTQQQVLEAIDGVQRGIESLKLLAQGDKPPYKSEDLVQRAEFGQTSLLPQLQRAQEEQAEHEQEVSVKFEESQRQLLAREEQQQVERKRKREEADKREQELAEERLALKEQAEEWTAAQELEAEKPKRKKKKGADDFINDMEVTPEPSPEPEPAADSDQEPAQVPETQSNGHGNGRRVVDDSDQDEDDGLF